MVNYVHEGYNANHLGISYVERSQRMLVFYLQPLQYSAQRS